jgi:hypothetical protein
LVFRNSDQENGRPTGSQTKLDVPTALAELFSDRSNTCFNATSYSRLAVSRCSTGLATHGDTLLRDASARQAAPWLQVVTKKTAAARFRAAAVS